MYEKDPEVVSLVIPQDFEQFPPEIDALRWLVYCHLRCGGESDFSRRRLPR